MVEAGDALNGRGEDNGEVELLVGGAEAVKQVENLVYHPVGARAGAVHLVDDNNRVQALLEGLGGHKAGLWHGAVYRIHQQQHGIHHGEYALDFAAKIGVSGRVHDVDAVVVPANGRVLGQNGDAALPLLVVGVHDALGPFRAAIKRSRLIQQAVHERGFAVVNVGDNGDVAKLLNQGEFLKPVTRQQKRRRIIPQHHSERRIRFR